jgi:hypothetical protein
MMENPPGLALNTLTLNRAKLDSAPFPGLLATDEQREAYFQYELELARRPPPEPPKQIEPGPNPLDMVMDAYQEGREAGREEVRNTERDARRCRMTGVVADDAILFGKHRDAGLTAKKARLEVINDLIKLGVFPKTAENRAAAARYFWEDNLAKK